MLKRTLISELENAINLLRRGKCRLHIPEVIERFKRRPNAHFHPTSELFIQTGGATDFRCEEHFFRLTMGEMCIMPPGVSHREIPVDLKTPYGVMVVMQARDGFIIQKASTRNGKEIAADSVEHFPSLRGRSAFRYLEEILSAELVPARYRKSFVRGQMESFLITLLSEASRPFLTKTSITPIVMEAIKLARSLISDPELSVIGLAALLKCSPDHLSKKFSEDCEVTFTQWMNAERILLAKSLLSETRYNISEIGASCGFSASSYFIRVFRLNVGVSPKVYQTMMYR